MPSTETGELRLFSRIHRREVRTGHERVPGPWFLSPQSWAQDSDRRRQLEIWFPLRGDENLDGRYEFCWRPVELPK